MKCIGEPTRLRIIRLLSQGEQCVGDMCQAFAKDQPLVSYHLRALRECGIVIARQETQKVYYHLADSILAQLLILIDSVVTNLRPCGTETACCDGEEVPDALANE